jgi:putative NADPH-quinone reductase
MAAICIIQGHPDAMNPHFCHALANAYAQGAEAAGHKVVLIDVATLDFPLLRNPADFQTLPPRVIELAQHMIEAADHLVIVYPLWLGGSPALLKGFFEQIGRNGFLIDRASNGWPRQMLKGRSAHVIVTMGMPALAYRLVFGAHGVKGLIGSVLGLSGLNPVRQTLIGNTGNLTHKSELGWFEKMKRLGRDAH